MGPIGSGKSVGCCVEIFSRASVMPIANDGIRHSRWAIVRNTQPQLETTTIKTWLSWFPEHIFGKMNRKPPFTHLVRINDIELEVIFLALDKPEDVKKLLSLEVTGIWFNEAREIEKEILDAASGRVGRYPSDKMKPKELGIRSGDFGMGLLWILTLLMILIGGIVVRRRMLGQLMNLGIGYPRTVFRLTRGGNFLGNLAV